MTEVTAPSRGGGGGRRSTWRRGSHCGGPRDPSPRGRPPALSRRRAPARAAALPGSDGERQCVPAPHARPLARCVSPLSLSPLHLPPSPRPQLLASPAPRRAAPESAAAAAAAAGKGCGPAALTRRRGTRGLDVPLPGAGKDGELLQGGERQATGPGEKGAKRGKGDGEVARAGLGARRWWWWGSRERRGPRGGQRATRRPGQARAGRRAEGE